MKTSTSTAPGARTANTARSGIRARSQAYWVPYRDGRWTYLQPWGWTWVDNAPWGYAPFHYGRWVTVGGRWCWSPGRNVTRAVWSPALVGWVGGSNWNVSFNSGGSLPRGPGHRLVSAQSARHLCADLPRQS
ncbi:hypothetical protein LP420_20690 [Massilia sp. B-10]|nr:hypothetical protein LP420_20690 [Massilia sp. B-10]